MTKKIDKNVNAQYGYFSKLLKEPFDTLEELKEAEEAFYAQQKLKEDAAAQKKADAKVVEDAFKALNTARREYKEKLAQLTSEYAESLENLKNAFDLGQKDIHNTLAAAEEVYKNALNEFTKKYENYHMTLKDGDFETTISNQTTDSNKANFADFAKIADIFDWLFKI
jgi:chromosome segregation ATPase